MLLWFQNLGLHYGSYASNTLHKDLMEARCCVPCLTHTEGGSHSQGYKVVALLRHLYYTSALVIAVIGYQNQTKAIPVLRLDRTCLDPGSAGCAILGGPSLVPSDLLDRPDRELQSHALGWV